MTSLLHLPDIDFSGYAAGIAIWQLGHQGTSRDLTESILRATAQP